MTPAPRPLPGFSATPGPRPTPLPGLASSSTRNPQSAIRNPANASPLHLLTSSPLHRRLAPAFTLIELLVVMGVIALLISITMPALGHARETSRRVKCMANLRSIGQGFAMYMNDSKGLLPRVGALHRDPPPGSSGNNPSLLEVLSSYLNAETPRKGDDGDYIATDPYRCPGDRGQTEDSGKPVWQQTGCSYEYLPGYGFFLLEALLVPDPQLGVTRAYEKRQNYPLVVDHAAFHKGRATGPGQNALLFGDFHADWYTAPTDGEKFFQDAVRAGGGQPLP